MEREERKQQKIGAKLNRLYRENAFTLFKGYTRPRWLGYMSTVIEFYIYFMLAMNGDVVSKLSHKDPLLAHIAKVTFVGSAQSHMTTIQWNIICLTINAWILAILLYFIVRLFLSDRTSISNQGPPLKSLLLSACIQSYSSVAFTLSFYVSLIGIKQTLIIAYINGIFSIIIGFMSCMHQSKFSFKEIDCLSRFSKLTELKRWGCMVAFVCVSAYFENTWSVLAYAFLCLKELLDWMISRQLLDEDMSRFRLQLLLSSLGFAFLMLITIELDKCEFASIASILSTVAILKAAAVLHDTRTKNDRMNFLEELLADSASNITKFRHSSQLDLFIRYIWKRIESQKPYLQDEESIFDELIINEHIHSCTRRPFCFCQEAMDVKSTMQIRDYLIDNGMRREFLLEFMHEIFTRCLSGSKRMCEISFSYLYFLSECLQNQPMFRIQLYEYHRHFAENMSIQELTMIEYLISVEKASLKTEQNIHEVLSFESEIEQLSKDMCAVVKMKESFIRKIAENHIDLEMIEKLGEVILENRINAFRSFKKLAKINAESERLNFLSSSFIYCLSFDENKDLLMKPIRSWRMKKFSKNIFSKNTSAIFVSLSKEDFGIIKKVSNSFMPVFNFSRNEVVGQNCSCIMPRNISIKHDEILHNFIDKGRVDLVKFKLLQPFFILNRQGFLMQVEMDLQMTLVGQDQIGVSGLISCVKDGMIEHTSILDIDSDYKIQGCTSNLFDNLFSEYVDEPNDCKAIYMSQLIPMLPLFVEDLLLENQENMHQQNGQFEFAVASHGGDDDGNNDQNAGGTKITTAAEQKLVQQQVKAAINKSQKIETLMFFPRANESNANASRVKGSNNGQLNWSNRREKFMLSPSRLKSAPIDLIEAISTGQFSLHTNDVYLVSIRFQTLIDEYLNMCIITFKTIKKIDNVIDQMEFIRSIFLEQVTEFHEKEPSFDRDEVDRYFSMPPMTISQQQIKNNPRNVNKNITYFNLRNHFNNAFVDCSSTDYLSPSNAVKNNNHLNQSINFGQVAAAAAAAANNQSSGQLTPTSKGAAGGAGDSIEIIGNATPRHSRAFQKMQDQMNQKQKQKMELLSKVKVNNTSFSQSSFHHHSQMTGGILTQGGGGSDDISHLIGIHNINNQHNHDLEESSHENLPQPPLSAATDRSTRRFLAGGFTQRNIIAANGLSGYSNSAGTIPQQNHINHSQNTNNESLLRLLDSSINAVNNKGTPSAAAAAAVVAQMTSTQQNIGTTTMTSIFSPKLPQSQFQIQSQNAVVSSPMVGNTVVPLIPLMSPFGTNRSNTLLNEDEREENDVEGEDFEEKDRNENGGRSNRNRAKSSNNYIVQSRANFSEGSSGQATRFRERQEAREVIENAHDQSVSSSRSQQFLAQKQIIRNAFATRKRNHCFDAVVFFAFLAIIAVCVVIILAYSNLTEEFNVQMKNFVYIPWGVTQRTSITRMIKNHNLMRFFGVDRYGFSATDQATFEPILAAQKITFYDNYTDQIVALINEPMVEIFIQKYVVSMKIEIGIYESDEDYVKIKDGVIPGFILNGLFLFQLSRLSMESAIGVDKVAMLNVYNNYISIVDDLSEMQSQQEDDVSNTNSNILIIVWQLLAVICAFSAVFTLSTFPVYSFAQAKKQRILSLFATIDPMRIKEIHRMILLSSAALQQDHERYKENNHPKIQQLTGRVGNAANKQRLIGMKAKKYRSNPMQVTVKDSMLVHKNKSISSTSILPRFSFSLLIKCVVIYVVIVTYPITDAITTNSLISQSQHNQDLSGVLSVMKGQIMSNMALFTLLSSAEMNLLDDFESVAKYRGTFNEQQAMNQSYLSEMQTVVQENEQFSRYNQEEFSSFFFALILHDACSALESNADHANAALLTIEECRTSNNGVLSHGLLTSISTFLAFFESAHEIFSMEATYGTTEMMNRYFLFLETNSLLEINALSEHLITLIDILNSFITVTNEEFFAQMETIQTAMMAFQFLVLFVVFQFAFLTFFSNTSDDLHETRITITILSITHISENPYIMNYLIK